MVKIEINVLFRLSTDALVFIVFTLFFCISESNISFLQKRYCKPPNRSIPPIIATLALNLWYPYFLEQNSLKRHDLFLNMQSNWLIISSRYF